MDWRHRVLMPDFEPTPRFLDAIRRFDELNAQDPNHDLSDGAPRPRELLYAERLTRWVLALAPDASETLRLAARSQHLCRWEIPRATYPADRPGYLRWRQDLKQFHARRSAEVLTASGYDSATINRVQALNLKKDLGRDPEVQVLEDGLCLVFLQYQLADLAERTDPDKVINALRKSWSKMSPAGRDAALRLDYGPREHGLLQQALQASESPGSSEPASA